MQPNTWAMVCHLCGLIGYAGNGIGSVVAPLIVWILKKDESELIDQHGKEALNFNISILIYFAILLAVSFMTFGIGFLITVPLMGILVVFHVVCTIIAALKANQGQFYRYPLTWRIID